MPDHYATLKVSRDAPAEVIQAAYRSLARKYHPDHGARTPDSEAAIKAINAAYEVLGDPTRRAAYDRDIERHSERPSTGHRSPSTGQRRPSDRNTPTDDFRRTLVTLLASICYFGAAFWMLRNPGLRYLGILMLLASLLYFRPRRP